jgi:hypothetical protein
MYMFLKKILNTFGGAGLVLCAATLVTPALAQESLFPNPTVMAPPAQPTKMPEFEFANLHGGLLKSSELKGKVIVIRFWATW